MVRDITSNFHSAGLGYGEVWTRGSDGAATVAVVELHQNLSATAFPLSIIQLTDPPLRLLVGHV